MSTSENAVHTTRFIRRLVSQDLNEPQEDSSVTCPTMVSIPFEELQQARLILRQFICYLKEPDPSQPPGFQLKDRLDESQLKRLAWVYERRIKSWLRRGEEAQEQDPVPDE